MLLIITIITIVIIIIIIIIIKTRKQQENEKPRYGRTLLEGQRDERRKFEDIEEASELWRALWEGTGSGNAVME